MFFEFYIKWYWYPGKENVVTDTLFKKWKDLVTAHEKIQASQEGRIINPAAIVKIPVNLATPYFNNVAVIYLNKTPNLSELESLRGI